MFKKIISLFFVTSIIVATSCIDLRASIQNNQAIPDEVAVLNNCAAPILVDGIKAEPGQTVAVKVNTADRNKGSLIVDQYTVKFPTYEAGAPTGTTSTTAHLDFISIAWFAKKPTEHNSLDAISIHNDSDSPITLIYSLNGLTPPTQVKPGITKEKKVAFTPTWLKRGKKGAVLISDGSQSYTVVFLRRIMGGFQTADFRSVVLRLSAIHWFNNGFSARDV